MKGVTIGRTDEVISATAAMADARAALQRAQAGQRKLAERVKASAADVARLKTRAAETAKALTAAEAAHKADTSQRDDWAVLATFATSDLAVAEARLKLAESKERAARQRAAGGDGGRTATADGLDEAVQEAEKALASLIKATGHADKRASAEKAEARLTDLRTAESSKRRMAAIDQKLAQLDAATSRTAAERAAWTEREKRVEEQLAKLADERQKLEAERKSLARR